MVTINDLETLEQYIRDSIEANQLEELGNLLSDEHPVDIADAIDRLDEDQQVLVFQLLPQEQAAEVLGATSADATRKLIAQLPRDLAGDLLETMPSDDAAEILSEDVPDQQHVLLEAMEREEADEVRNLLRYPPQSAGRLMTEKFVHVSADMTAAQTLDHLRQIDPEVETISNLYVLDTTRHLQGVVTLREIITNSQEQPLSSFMLTEPITVTPEIDQEEVARLVSQYDLLSLPVVSPEGCMLGIITVDDVIDVLVEEGTEDVLRFGGVEGGSADETYFSTPIWRAVRRRVGWLMLLFLTGTLTINVLGFFETALSQVVALSFFIPLLIGTGGNTGAQTVSTIIRGMALGEIRKRDALKVTFRELASGLLLGTLLGLIAFGLALFIGNTIDPDNRIRLAGVVGLSIVAICTWSNVIGALVPLGAKKLKLDPALVSAPMITTLVDASGLAIYMLIAKALLGI
ncbi:MAG: magnesium transporter [Chloroflexota bacterium]